jgi:hypothetical protein
MKKYSNIFSRMNPKGANEKLEKLKESVKLGTLIYDIIL